MISMLELEIEADRRGDELRREAAQRRLARLAQQARHAQPAPGPGTSQQLLAWLGTQLAGWGARLQRAGATAAERPAPARLQVPRVGLASG